MEAGSRRSREQRSREAEEIVNGRQEVEEVGSRGGRKLPGDEGRAEEHWRKRVKKMKGTEKRRKGESKHQ